MPEPHLNGPCVIASVGQSVAAGIAQHVGMSLQLEAGRCRPLDHAREAGRRERGAALANDAHAASSREIGEGFWTAMAAKPRGRNAPLAGLTSEPLKGAVVLRLLPACCCNEEIARRLAARSCGAPGKVLLGGGEERTGVCTPSGLYLATRRVFTATSPVAADSRTGCPAADRSTGRRRASA